MTNGTIADILTRDEMTRVQVLWRRLKNTGRFASAVGTARPAPDDRALHAHPSPPVGVAQGLNR